MLCLTCLHSIQAAAAFTSDLSSSSGHHEVYQTLQESIREGCYICNRFWEALSGEERDFISGTQKHSAITEISFNDAKVYGHPGCDLLAVAYNTQSDLLSPIPSRLWRASFLLEPINQENSSLAHHKSLSRDMRSSATLSLAKQWVMECTRHHERCRQRSTVSWYPTRLLTFDLDDSPLLRLLETEYTTPAGKYTTVSHCWGSADEFLLTKDTYTRLLSGLPLSALPRVFQDAVLVSHHLGARNIWIDSLCIFQDKEDRADWEHEASQMAEIYSNSYCNISAADADDCSKSLFSPRDPNLLCPQTIELTVPNRGSETGPHDFFLYDYRFWDFHVMDAPVNKRAWVLQERILSSRVLHFGRRQLLWECCEKDAAEVFPDGLPGPLTLSSHAGMKQLDPVISAIRVRQYSPPVANGLSASHLLWWSIVQTYTSCKLSVPSDKLIACSGIAKRMAKITGDTYIAGMWRRYLEGELLWSVKGSHPAGSSSRPDTYRAPTWSWAAVDGPVAPGLPRVEGSLVAVEDAHLDYWTTDTMGAVQSGWLRLRGVLKKTRLERLEFPSHAGPAWRMVLQGADVTEPDGVYGTEPRVMLDVFQERFDEENAKGLLFCMPARSSPGDGRGMYVLLFELVGGQEGTFQRIGIAYAWSEKVKNRLLEKRPGEANLPCLEYRDGMHSIHVI